MEITRDVILDMMPLYLADEVSADTRTLIEKYLETDPELAKRAKQQKATMELSEKIPVRLTEGTQMKAYKKSKIILYITIVILAVLIAAIFGITFMSFFVSA